MRWISLESWTRSLPVLAVLALVTTLAGPARANGRFPRSERLVEAPGDAATLLLGTTYGLLVSADRGASWHHVCEAAFAGHVLNNIDSVVDLTDDGAILIAFGEAMARAPLPGCAFGNVLGGDSSERVVDFSALRSDRQHVLALVAHRDSSDPGSTRLLVSDDGGQHFDTRVNALPVVANFATTLEQAPSDPNRVYVSGVDATGQGVLLVSSDGGLSFPTMQPIPDTDAAHTPYIAAIHPSHPDWVFVRIDGTLQDIVSSADDSLLVTRDAGASFSEVLHVGGKLYGFALNPGGDRVLAGVGDPRDETIVDPDAVGIHGASIDSSAVSPFQRLYAKPVSCLSWTATGLYACATDDEAGFQLGFRADAAFTLGDAAPFTPLLLVQNVQGAVECPAMTPGARCAEDWPTICPLLKACGGSGGGASSSAGFGGSSGTRGGAGGSPGGAAGAANGAARSSSGCGCRVAARDPLRAASGLALLAAGLYLARRLARAKP